MTRKTSGERHNYWQFKPEFGEKMTLSDLITKLESYDLPKSMDKEFFLSQVERMKNALQLSKTIKKYDLSDRAEKLADEQNFACTKYIIGIVEKDIEAESLEKYGLRFDENTGTLIDERLRSDQKSEAIYGPDYVSYISSLKNGEDDEE